MRNLNLIARFSLLALTVIFILVLLIKVWSILIPFFLGGFFAYLLAPLVKKLEYRGLKRIPAILIVYFIVFGSLAALGFFGLPILINELSTLVKTLPNYAREAEKEIYNFQLKYANYGLPQGVKAVIDERVVKIEKEVLNILRLVLNQLLNGFSYIITLVVTPVVAFYFLKDSELLKRDVENLIPKQFRGDAFALFRDMDDIISAYIRGHLIVSLLIGILTGSAMYIIGLKYAFILGVVAAFTEIIPYFGPLIGAIPAIIIALFQSTGMAIKVVIAIIVIQQIETNVISPNILGETIGLHPLTIIFVILAGGHLFGILGMLLAVPLTAISKVLVRYIYLKLVG